MTDNNINKRFFTEGASPIPLIPADVAWENMNQMLEKEDPEKKKRRLIFWLPPFVWGVFIVLLTGAAVITWWGRHTSETAISEQRNSKPEIKAAGNREIANKRKQKGITTADAQQTFSYYKQDSNTTTKVVEPGNVSQADTINIERLSGMNQKNAKAKKLSEKSVSMQAANDYGGQVDHENGVQWPVVHQEKKKRPVREAAVRRQENGALSFAYPQRIETSDTIWVQVNQPLSAPLSHLPASDSMSKKICWIEAGVQWNIPVSLAAYNYYLKGPDGNNQFYRLLLPGLWLSVNMNRQRIMANINPFVSAPLPDKDYENSVIPGAGFGTMGYKRMIKMFGYQAGLHYAYQFDGHWWLGGGMDANWWKKGLVLAKPVDSISNFKPFLYSIDPGEEKEIIDFQMSANLSLGYQFKACEAAIQVSAPFNKTIKTIPSPVWLRLGLRWRMMHRQYSRQ